MYTVERRQSREHQFSVDNTNFDSMENARYARLLVVNAAQEDGYLLLSGEYDSANICLARVKVSNLDFEPVISMNSMVLTIKEISNV